MPADLLGALDTLDRAIAHASTVVPEERLQEVAETARRVRRRRGFLGSTVVMALAGGTGSGKSSVLNALAGEEIAPTGVRRPVTDRPLAWVPGHPEPGVIRLLDELEIEQRVGQDRYPHLTVIDLPDHDSVVLDHRATVERLLPLVDAVAWVVDPEKYNDAALHERYLDPLSGYASQFIFVLNQIDRLDPEDLEPVLADLTGTLRRDGISHPRIFPLAADPPDGKPERVEELARYLEERINAKEMAIAKLREDLRRAGHRLAAESGIEEGTGLDYDLRWDEQSAELAGALARMGASDEFVSRMERARERDAARVGGAIPSRLAALAPRTWLGRALGGRTVLAAPRESLEAWRAQPGLEDALADLTEFVTDLSFETGGAFGQRLREEFGPDRLEEEVRRGMESAVRAVPVTPEPSGPLWWKGVGAAQFLLLLGVITGAIWAWARPESLERGTWPVPLILILGGILLAVLLGRAVRWSGRRRGRREALEVRRELETEISRRLDGRVGVPLRELLRDRAVVGAALAELGLALAASQRR